MGFLHKKDKFTPIYALVEDLPLVMNIPEPKTKHRGKETDLFDAEILEFKKVEYDDKPRMKLHRPRKSPKRK